MNSRIMYRWTDKASFIGVRRPYSKRVENSRFDKFAYIICVDFCCCYVVWSIMALIAGWRCNKPVNFRWLTTGKSQICLLPIISTASRNGVGPATVVGDRIAWTMTSSLIRAASGFCTLLNSRLRSPSVIKPSRQPSALTIQTIPSLWLSMISSASLSNVRPVVYCVFSAEVLLPLLS